MNLLICYIPLIVVIGGIIGVVANYFFNFTYIKDNLKDKHTLQKAEEYHNLETKDIKETRNDVKRTEDLITQVSTATGGISKDIQLLGKDFSNYKENVDRVGSNDRSLSDAVKTFENHIQELGQIYKEKEMLVKKVAEFENTIQQLQSNLEKQNTVLQTQEQRNQELIKIVEDFKKESVLLKSDNKNYKTKISELESQLKKDEKQIQLDNEDELEL